jgi:hypothetical protein
MAVSQVKRRRIFARDGYRCRYCGHDMTLHFPYPHLGVLTVDHVVPKVHGGTDRNDNLVTCCFDCNNWKCNRPAAEFLRDLYLYGEPGRGADDRRLRWFVVRARLIREVTAGERSQSVA